MFRQYISCWSTRTVIAWTMRERTEFRSVGSIFALTIPPLTFIFVFLSFPCTLLHADSSLSFEFYNFSNCFSWSLIRHNVNFCVNHFESSRIIFFTRKKWKFVFLLMELVNLLTWCCVVGQLNPGAQRHVRSAWIITRFWKARRLFFNNLQKKWQICKNPNIYCKIK